MKKIIAVIISCLFISCTGRKQQLSDLSAEPKINYTGDVSQIINSKSDVLRFSMNIDSFNKFKDANSERWLKWTEYDDALYITTNNEVDYVFHFSDLSYSVFRDHNKNYSNLIIWRSDINELWVFKVTLLM
jgi:hypothetical protein